MRRSIKSELYATLQVSKVCVEISFGEVYYVPEQAEGELFADHSQGLQQGFLFCREPVDTGSEHRLDGWWDVEILR